MLGINPHPVDLVLESLDLFVFLLCQFGSFLDLLVDLLEALSLLLFESVDLGLLALVLLQESLLVRLGDLEVLLQLDDLVLSAVIEA